MPGASVVFNVDGNSPVGYKGGNPNVGDLAVTSDDRVWIYVGGSGGTKNPSNWKLLDTDSTDDGGGGGD